MLIYGMKPKKQCIKRLPVIAAPVAALVVLMMFSLATQAAYADMIAGPDNDFFRHYEGEIVDLGRNFIANSESGSVDVKEAPGMWVNPGMRRPGQEAGKTIASLKNGDVEYMQYSCFYDGEFWGFTPQYSGWVELDQMLVLYDYIAFAEDHPDELYYYDGGFKKIMKTRSAIAWPWPGADAPLWTLEDIDMERFTILYAYKDEEGREWGFVPYTYGRGNLWVCLSDPLNPNLPASGPTPEPSVWVSETPHIDIKQNTQQEEFPVQQEEFPVMIIIIVLVAALVAGTAVLIRVFWKVDRTRRC